MADNPDDAALIAHQGDAGAIRPTNMPPLKEISQRHALAPHAEWFKTITGRGGSDE